MIFLQIFLYNVYVHNGMYITCTSWFTNFLADILKDPRHMCKYSLEIVSNAARISGLPALAPEEVPQCAVATSWL